MSKTLLDIAKENCNLRIATIELNDTCNWRCVHCYIPEHNNMGLSKNEIFDLIYDLKENGCYEVVLTGGEIFLRTDIIEIIEFIRRLGLEIQLFTNVSLLDENIIKKIKNLYITKISTTIFSLDKRIHDGITQTKGSLNNSLKNLELLHKYNIPTEVKTILMKNNKNEYNLIHEYCKQHNFKYIATTNIFPRTDLDKSPKNYEISENDLFDILPEIDEYRSVKYAKKDHNDYICPECRNSIFIDSYGDVYPCELYRLKLGNVKKNKIYYIWKNIQLIELQNFTYDNSECVNCEDKIYCNRCSGVAEREGNGIRGKSNSECINAKIRRMLIEK